MPNLAIRSLLKELIDSIGIDKGAADKEVLKTGASSSSSGANASTESRSIQAPAESDAVDGDLRGRPVRPPPSSTPIEAEDANSEFEATSLSSAGGTRGSEAIPPPPPSPPPGHPLRLMRDWQPPPPPLPPPGEPGFRIARAGFSGREYGDTYLNFAERADLIQVPHAEAGEGWAFGVDITSAPFRAGWFPEDFGRHVLVPTAGFHHYQVRVAFDGSQYGDEYLSIGSETHIERILGADEIGWAKVRLVNSHEEGWIPLRCLEKAT